MAAIVEISLLHLAPSLTTVKGGGNECGQREARCTALNGATEAAIEIENDALRNSFPRALMAYAAAAGVFDLSVRMR